MAAYNTVNYLADEHKMAMTEILLGSLVAKEAGLTGGVISKIIGLKNQLREEEEE